MQIITKLFVQIYLQLYGTRRRVAPATYDTFLIITKIIHWSPKNESETRNDAGWLPLLVSQNLLRVQKIRVLKRQNTRILISEMLSLPILTKLIFNIPTF